MTKKNNKNLDLDLLVKKENQIPKGNMIMLINQDVTTKMITDKDIEMMIIIEETEIMTKNDETTENTTTTDVEEDLILEIVITIEEILTKEIIIAEDPTQEIGMIMIEEIINDTMMTIEEIEITITEDEVEGP